MEDWLESVLPLVEKPGRYVGGEEGAAPPAAPGDLRFVLCYPDVYEIGVSHRGFLNLYAALAAAPGVAVERCFAPWPDFAAALRARGRPLATLESGFPLGEADVLGFSFSTPLAFATAVAMLELAGVPPLARDRGAGEPLVVAGGQATFNPEPLAPFVDAVVLGEGEEVVAEVAAAAREAKGRREPRAETLARLAAIPGVYVPALYEPRYEGGAFAATEPREGAPPRVRKRAVAAFGRAAAPALVATIPPTHDRVTVEVMRGCVWGCRFCQAGMVNRPARERDAASALAEARALAAATGAGELALLALNACDYAGLEPLLHHIRSSLPGLKLSLPAARVLTYRGDVSRALITQRRNQQTFAPEAASDRLRRVINKDFTNADVVATAAAAAQAGCQNLKLYFMLGLPGETDEDAAAVGELVASCRAALREGLGRWGNVSVALAPFVPQPHTPFQWLGMAPADVLRRRLALARRGMPRRTKVDAGVGGRVVEAALARGDRRLADVVLAASRAGAYLDAWADFFRADRWEAAFAACGFDAAAWATRELEPGAPLPWDHLDAGVTKDYLRRELERALAGEVTAPCADAACRRCGACDDELALAAAPVNLGAAPAAAPAATAGDAGVAQRLRFTYGRGGRLRWLSHLEFARLWLAQLRRAGIPLARSSGFSPRPRFHLAPALPVGVAGDEEWGEVFLREKVEPAAFRAAVNAAGEIKVGRAWEVPAAAPALETELSGARYEVTLGPLAAAAGVDAAALNRDAGVRLAAGELTVESKRHAVDLAPAFRLVSWDEGRGVLVFDLAAAAGVVFDLVAHLTGVDRRLARAAGVRRRRVHAKGEADEAGA